jgi:hypothetical protein
MHAFSILTLGIFIAGYSTARWDLVTRLYELAIFAWDHGVVVSLLWTDVMFEAVTDCCRPESSRASPYSLSSSSYSSYLSSESLHTKPICTPERLAQASRRENS